MRKSNVTLTLILAVIVTACGSLAEPRKAAPGTPLLARAASAPVHRVIGGGELDVAALFAGANKESYGFTAMVDGAGNAHGQMAIDFSDTAPFHLEVTCLSVNGRDAWIGGVVTQTHDESAVPVGTEMWVRVRDNGNGANGTPDQMGFFRWAPASFCALQRPASLAFNWLHGDITVE